MCLGVPGQVVEVFDDDASLRALVELDGVRREVSLEVLGHEAEVQVGDWVLAHLGFALTKLDEAEAVETLAMLEMLKDPEGSSSAALGGDR